MKTLTVKLPDELAARLKSLAEERGQGQSTLVRGAIEGLVTSERSHQPESCRGLARDLEGSIAGPPDLSHNPAHLQRYGQ